MPLNSDELSHIKELIVEPLSQRFDELKVTLAAAMTDASSRIAEHERRLSRVEQFQGKVLIVWGMIVAGLTAAATYFGQWIARKMGWTA